MKVEIRNRILRLIPETAEEHLNVDKAIRESVKNGLNTWSANTNSDNSGERAWDLEIDTI